MLSKEDFEKYIKSMEKLESDMFYSYKTCGNKVEDKEVKKVCRALFTAEAKHDYSIKKIIKLLNLS